MVVVFVNDESQTAAETLAHRFSLPTTRTTPDGYYLCYNEGQLQLKDARQPSTFGIYIDIDGEVARLKKQRINYKKDLLCRAMGYKGQENYVIFDGTLGFGKDALHMVTVGCKIVACERQPVVFALMEDALKRSQDHSAAFAIHWGESKQFLEKTNDNIDCIYLDPMFEDTRKKSSPKKQMAFLREVSPNDLKTESVMELWPELAIKRMVVKRAIKSDYLFAKPNLTFAGNLVRYDVYTR